jgi:hypothetical protein
MPAEQVTAAQARGHALDLYRTATQILAEVEHDIQCAKDTQGVNPNLGAASHPNLGAASHPNFGAASHPNFGAASHP